MTAIPLPAAATPWGAILCMTLMSFTLIASEFMPVAVLTPVAADLGITEGRAGQAIAVSGFFAVATSLFSNALLSRLDRRTVVLLYTGVMVVSGLCVALAPNALWFMTGRALIGVSIGGFFSISTAIMARLAAGPDLVRALAWLQAGSALAAVLAQPFGSLVGGWIGWRAAFFTVVPVGLAALLWQLAALPRIPGGGRVAVRDTFTVLGHRGFALGMVAMTFFFTGQFALSTYLRPFLESVAGLGVQGLSLVLLALGLAGLAGTAAIGRLLRRHLALALIGLPAALAAVGAALLGFGHLVPAVVLLLVVWGFLTAPAPVAWTTWMTRVIPDRLEAGGGMLVALIQVAITFGAFSGGVLFDRHGWWAAFAAAVLFFLASSLVALAVARRV